MAKKQEKKPKIDTIFSLEEEFGAEAEKKFPEIYKIVGLFAEQQNSYSESRALNLPELVPDDGYDHNAFVSAVMQRRDDSDKVAKWKGKLRSSLSPEIQVMFDTWMPRWEIVMNGCTPKHQFEDESRSATCIICGAERPE